MNAGDLLVLRVDAGLEVGTGHAMRCLALAQAWKDGHGDVLFAHAEFLPAMEERLRKEGFESHVLPVSPGSPEDARATADVARERGAAWTVLDGYRFDGRFQATLKENGLRLLVIDDFGHAGEYAADLVLDQNAGADPAWYAKRAEHTRLLLGPRYVLLGRALRARHPPAREVPPNARHILVSFGGVDARDLSSRVLRSLEHAKLDSPEVRLVVGPGNPHVTSLEAAAKRSALSIRLERDPADMAEGMTWADLAIAGAGTTTWELAYLGVPSVLVATAENQRRVAEGVAALGAAVSLGWHEGASEERIAQVVGRLAADPGRRRELGQRARELVDGDGVSRVLTEMRAGLIELRPVAADDARLLFEWANDPSVRAVSFTTEAIPWEHHVQWLAGKLGEPTTFFFVASDTQRKPFGQIRFDVHGDEAEVSVSLDTRSRGRGLGSALIIAGSRKLFGSSRVRAIEAYVKDGNEPSVRAFLRAGYAPRGRARVRGHDAQRFTLRREDLP